MSHRLDDITLYYGSNDELDRKFTGRQNLVSDLYIQFLNKYKPKRTSRISVELRDKDSIKGYFGSILLADAAFDKNEYWKKDEFGQNKQILDTVHRIALLSASEFSWDTTVFEEAYRQTLNCEFRYHFEYGRKLSRDRKHYAAIAVEKDENKATISVVYYDKFEKPIKRVKLLDTWQWHQGFYSRIIKKSKWLDNNSFGYITPSKEIVFKAHLKTGETEVLVFPLVESRDTLLKKLDSINYREVVTPEDLKKIMAYDEEQLEKFGISVSSEKLFETLKLQ